MLAELFILLEMQKSPELWETFHFLQKAGQPAVVAALKLFGDLFPFQKSRDCDSS